MQWGCAGPSTAPPLAVACNFILNTDTKNVHVVGGLDEGPSKV